MTQELDFYCYLILINVNFNLSDYMWLVVTTLDRSNLECSILEVGYCVSTDTECSRLEPATVLEGVDLECSRLGAH